MPPHWDPPSEVEAFKDNGKVFKDTTSKDEATRKEEKKKAARALLSNLKIDLSESQMTKAAVIGSVIALRDAMRLLAAETKVQAKPGDNAKKAEDPGHEAWPTYTQFECYSCHHDLSSPGYLAWRQARGFGQWFDGQAQASNPGRPRLRPWPLALVPLALAQAGAGNARKELMAGVEALHAALDSHPFGQAADVAAAAEQVARAADTLLTTLQSTKFTPAVAPKLVEALTKLPAEAVRDFDSARQVVWAIKTIYSENKPTFKADESAVNAALKDLDGMLKLDPYETRFAFGNNPNQPKAGVNVNAESEKEIRKSLSCAAGFDPDEFARKLAALGKLM
jgi:hypothetical protein